MVKNKSKAKSKNKKSTSRKIPYSDPCFHCKNLEITGTGMRCKKDSEALWNDEQGFEVDDKGHVIEPCLKFSELNKK